MPKIVPKISIIIPVYNGIKNLEECLRHICVSTYKDYEIIVVDDSSTDRPGRLLKSILKI